MSVVLLLALCQQAIGPDAQRTLAEWRAQEGIERWIFYRDRIRGSEAASSFHEYLVAAREFEFLEELVLYEQDQLIASLFPGDAPQAIRDAVWSLGLRDSHAREKALAWLQQEPGLVLDWLRRHAAAGEPRALELAHELERAGHVPEDSSRFLPPLDPEQVFAHLLPGALPAERAGWPADSPERLRLVAAIERELAGLAARERHEPPWPERVLALASAADADVRRAAYLAFCAWDPREVPVDELLRRALDPAREPVERELALLAYSYGPRPRIAVELHDFARDPAQPCWPAALARLGELGDGFTLRQLDGLDPGALSPEQRAILERERGRMAERERVLEASLREHPAAVRELLERTAWADLSCHRLEGELGEWTRATLGRWRETPEIRAALLELARGYEPEPWLESGLLFGSLRERVRSYAQDALH
jgi:hypothetical protein